MEDKEIIIIQIKVHKIPTMINKVERFVTHLQSLRVTQQ